MPDPTDLFITIMLVVGGGIAIAAFIRRRRDPFHVARRGRARVPRTPLRATCHGEWAHVAGVAVGRETLTSPLTGRPCLGYRYVIEAYEENGSVALRAEDCASFTWPPKERRRRSRGRSCSAAPWPPWTATPVLGFASSFAARGTRPGQIEETTG